MQCIKAAAQTTASKMMLEMNQHFSETVGTKTFMKEALLYNVWIRLTFGVAKRMADDSNFDDSRF